MRLFLLALLAGLLSAQVPGHDRRNTEIPHTSTHFAAPPERTLQQWKDYREHLLDQVRFAAGVMPEFEKTSLNPEVFGTIQREGYTVSKVLLETFPGYYLGGNLYRPDGAGPFPAIAKPHGHWTYGRLENQPLNSSQILAANLALRGVVVFSYDMVGYNDTLQTPHRFSGKAEQLWNFTPLGLQTWNSIRVVDYLESLSYVDATRIGATGASGGGTQTFVLSALDERISAAAPVNMISAIMQGGCVCENAPGLRIGTFNVEIAALMAPRPLLMVAATGDWTKNTPREEFPWVRAIYSLYGRPEQVSSQQFDAPHNFHEGSRGAVYRFFSKRLLNKEETGEEHDTEIEQPRVLLARYGRSAPADSLSYHELFSFWKSSARRQLKSATSDEQRALIALAVKAALPKSVSHSLEGDAIVLGRPGAGDRVAGRWFPGSGAPLLVVHEDGAAAALAADEVTAARSAGRPVLAIDAFQTGSATAPRDRSQSHFLTFNLTDDANRVQDILTAIGFLKSASTGTVEVSGIGRGAVWSLFAGALAPEGVKLTGDISSFRGTDEEFATHLFVPGIQRAGGLEAALQLTAGQRVKPQ